MKKTAILALSLCILMACNNPSENQEHPTEEISENEVSIGGDKDEHGCLIAAGYTWSELKQECLQVFEAGLRLNPIHINEGDAIISSFIIFSEDKSKVELFIDEQSIILEKVGDDVYQHDAYKFDGKAVALFINGIKKYEAEKGA
jgi:hypothetical protein